jgi:hypothetical protein
VIEALLVPSAGTLLALVVMVEVPASVGNTSKVTSAVCVIVTPSVSSVAV